MYPNTTSPVLALLVLSSTVGVAFAIEFKLTQLCALVRAEVTELLALEPLASCWPYSQQAASAAASAERCISSLADRTYPMSTLKATMPTKAIDINAASTVIVPRRFDFWRGRNIRRLIISLGRRGKVTRTVASSPASREASAPGVVLRMSLQLRQLMLTGSPGVYGSISASMSIGAVSSDSSPSSNFQRSFVSVSERTRLPAKLTPDSSIETAGR